MCFIKSIYKPPLFHDFLIPQGCNSENLKLLFSRHETSLSIPIQSSSQFSKNPINSSLQSLITYSMEETLKKNSFSMNFINEKISQCQNSIEDILKMLEESEEESIVCETVEKQTDSDVWSGLEKSGEREEQSENLLTRKLFGERKYKYKLRVKEEFSKVIYKERNMRVNVQLTNMNGSVIKNSNVVNLCLGLADDNGNWVTMNRVSDPMLKGKTEVELYHGEAQFNKIYTKDISRTFPNGHLNIVIYAKPSILIYNGLTSEYEEHVEVESVEPLVIEEVVIKAKKKY